MSGKTAGAAESKRGIKGEEPKAETGEKSTRRQILLSGIRLFSKYGYDATTMRMIAENAGVFLSQISFYYKNKETLYRACLEFISGLAEEFYADAFEKAQSLLARGSVSREEAYNAICGLIDRQIVAASGKRYRSSLKLIYWEQVNPQLEEHPISDTIFRRVEKVVADLITASTGMTEANALVASRFLNGAVIAFGEHSLLVGYAMEAGETEKGIHEEWVLDDITSYCYMFIRDILGTPKNFGA